MIGVGAGIGNKDWAYTPVIGDGAWLLGIKAWFMSDTVGAQGAGCFCIRAGAGKPNSYEEVLAWRNLLPIYRREPFVEWNFHGEEFSFDWSLSQRLAKTEDRFGITINSSTATAGLSMRASFEIMEG
ncbi:hypothetical protein ES705_25222 [subsurface metagenome]